MRRTLAIVALAAATAGPAAAAGRAPLAAAPGAREVLAWAHGLHLHGWRHLGYTDQEALFVTDPSNRLDPPRLRFWLRRERFGPPAAGEARSDRRLIEADCREMRFRQIDSRAYADNDLRGELLDSGRTAPWQAAKDADVQRAIVFACMTRG
jgi:hypothetical protein